MYTLTTGSLLLNVQRSFSGSANCMLAGPTALIVAIVEKIDVAKDCSNLASLPTISVLVGDSVSDSRPVLLCLFFFPKKRAHRGSVDRFNDREKFSEM